jgi:serine/threonine-protein kinase ATR
LFVRELVPKFPPVFYQWFKEIAPEPTAWFAARRRFTRTAAVMSMAGYIVGYELLISSALLISKMIRQSCVLAFDYLFLEKFHAPIVLKF